MDVKQAVLERRAIRRYTEEIITKENIDHIIEAGMWAPSGGNSQARVFIVVTDPDQVRAIRNCSPGILGVPPLIIALGTDKTRASEYGGTDWRLSANFDNAMAIENMMLRAWELDIGSCPFLSFDKTKVLEILRIPDTVDIDLLVTFGIPAYIESAPPRSMDLIFSDFHGKKYSGTVQENVKQEPIKKTTFEKESIEDLLSFVVFSAKALPGEPKEYGVFRLLEVAGRLVDSYPKIEKNEKLLKIKEVLDSLRFGEMLPEDEQRKKVDELSKLL